MKKPLKSAVLLALLTLGACSTPHDTLAPGPAILPFSATRHGTSEGDAHYAIGRYYQGQVRYDQAIQSYRKVLDLRPDHAEARNALGVIYAIEGQWAMAEAEFEAALKLAPDAAHIHNNRGYALLLQGRPEAAVAAFEAALRLDPDNTRAADNLRIARARLPASSADPGPAARRPGENAPTALPEVSPLRVDTAASGTLVAVSAHVYELRLPGVERGKAESAVPSGGARLEVANGNGVDGLARRTSAYLQQAGYATVRLTNRKPYDQARTEIQYRPGFVHQARHLQALLAGGSALAESSRLRWDVEVRVVLGKDLRSAVGLIEGASPDVSPAREMLAGN